MVGTRNNSKMRIARCMQCSGRTPYDVGSSVLLLYGSRRLAKIAQFFGGSPALLATVLSLLSTLVKRFFFFLPTALANLVGNGPLRPPY